MSWDDGRRCGVVHADYGDWFGGARSVVCCKFSKCSSRKQIIDEFRGGVVLMGVLDWLILVRCQRFSTRWMK